MVYFSLSFLDHFARPQREVGRLSFEETVVSHNSFSARRRTLELSAHRGLHGVSKTGLRPRIGRHVRRERCHFDHVSPPLKARPRQSGRTSYVLDFPRTRRASTRDQGPKETWRYSCTPGGYDADEQRARGTHTGLFDVHARDRASDDWTLNLTRTFKDREVTRADRKTPSRSLFPN